MSKIKEIRVRVTFEVGIGDLDADQIQIQQLQAAALNSATVSDDSRSYPFAAEWLNQNVDQRESLGHEYEIISIETVEQ